MTAQFAEWLRYEGEDLSMCSNPLNAYFALGGVNPGFKSTCTALWRGYVGSWEIVGERLYLVHLEGTLQDDRPANLATVFPHFPERVFAHWYSGTLRIPQGKRLEYVHMGYGSIYERDLFLTLEKGVITKTKVQQNGTADAENASEGYGVAGFTVFAQGKQEQ